MNLILELMQADDTRGGWFKRVVASENIQALEDCAHITPPEGTNSWLLYRSKGWYCKHAIQDIMTAIGEPFVDLTWKEGANVQP